jgi:glycosyltransferase involved in cell wall biosynthesis
MRVAFNGLFLGRTDGTGRYSAELLHANRSNEALGIEPEPIDWSLILPPGAQYPTEGLNARAHSVAPPFPIRTENLVKLWFEQIGVPTVTRAVGADLVHYPYFAAPIRASAPVVVTIHDLVPLLLPEYRGSPLVRAYMWLQAWTARRARRVLTDSHAAAADITRRLAIRRDRIDVIHLGVDRDWAPSATDDVMAARQIYQLPERYLLYFGGLDRRKNLIGLLRAYRQARESHGLRTAVAITGDAERVGAVFPALRPEIARLELDDHVHLLGHVPTAHLRPLATGCRAFVYPSRYEGFGLPVLEAMACGAVVACSNATSLPEVAGDAALLFPPDDIDAMAIALARVDADDALRDDLRQRGLARAATFTWEATARKTRQSYRAALGRPR